MNPALTLTRDGLISVLATATGQPAPATGLAAELEQAIAAVAVLQHRVRRYDAALVEAIDASDGWGLSLTNHRELHDGLLDAGTMLHEAEMALADCAKLLRDCGGSLDPRDSYEPKDLPEALALSLGARP